MNLLDELWPSEAQALGDFLVHVLALEEELSATLTRYYAHPSRAAEFRRSFLTRLTFGGAVDRLAPLAETPRLTSEFMADLRSIVTIRNLVAHSRPNPIQGRTLDDGTIELDHGWTDRQPPLFVVDLEEYTATALRLNWELSKRFG